MDSSTSNTLLNGIGGHWANLWKHFLVYIDPSYSKEDYSLVNNALYTLQSELWGCLKFGIYPYGSPKPNSGDFIHVKNESGCWSLIGKIGGAQPMSLESPGCMDQGTILHEMIHALGLFHEHTRKDRNEHIRVIWRNIQLQNQHNFYINGASSSFGVPYNINSIMHYDAHAFSKNGQPTIVSIVGEKFGNYELQRTDVVKIRRLYKCQTF